MSDARIMILNHIVTIDRELTSGHWTGPILASLLLAKSQALIALAQIDTKS